MQVAPLGWEIPTVPVDPAAKSSCRGPCFHGHPDSNTNCLAAPLTFQLLTGTRAPPGTSFQTWQNFWTLEVMSKNMPYKNPFSMVDLKSQRQGSMFYVSLLLFLDISENGRYFLYAPLYFILNARYFTRGTFVAKRSSLSCPIAFEILKICYQRMG